MTNRLFVCYNRIVRGVKLMLDLNEQKIEIKIRDVFYKAERDVLPYYVRKNRHSNGIVFYIQGGHAHLMDSGEEFVSRDRDLLCLSYGSDYVSRVKNPRIEYYQIDYELYKDGAPISLFDKFKILPKPASERLLPYFTEIYNLYTARPYAYVLKATGALMSLLAAVLCELDEGGASSAARRRVDYALNYLTERYFDSISIKKLAELGNISLSYLEKSFIEATGKSPADYRNSIRIEHAKTLLLGGFSIAEVAERVGFSDVYYFAKTFKRYTGITPGAFIKS